VFPAFLAAVSAFPVGEGAGFYTAQNRRRIFLIPGMVGTAGDFALYATNAQQTRTNDATTAQQIPNRIFQPTKLIP